MNKYVIILLSIVLVIACDRFRGSPFSTEMIRSEANLNQKSLNVITDPEADALLKIAVFADPHQNYNDLDGVVDRINANTGIDFVVNLGDFTNSGYNMEYDQFLKFYTFLKPIAFTVPGNHDMIGAGSILYKEVFGPYNYYFESSNFRFIFFNSINLESPKNFDLSWLESTVAASTKPIVIFSHIHFQDPERFTGDIAQRFDQIINDANVKLILNGHKHIYSVSTEGGTVLLQVPRVQNYQWLILEMDLTGVKVVKKLDGSEEWFAFKP